MRKPVDYFMMITLASLAGAMFEFGQYIWAGSFVSAAFYFCGRALIGDFREG